MGCLKWVRSYVTSLEVVMFLFMFGLFMVVITSQVPTTKNQDEYQKQPHSAIDYSHHHPLGALPTNIAKLKNQDEFLKATALCHNNRTIIIILQELYLEKACRVNFNHTEKTCARIGIFSSYGVLIILTCMYIV